MARAWGQPPFTIPAVVLATALAASGHYLSGLDFEGHPRSRRGGNITRRRLFNDADRRAASRQARDHPDHRLHHTVHRRSALQCGADRGQLKWQRLDLLPACRDICDGHGSLPCWQGSRLQETRAYGQPRKDLGGSCRWICCRNLGWRSIRLDIRRASGDLTARGCWKPQAILGITGHSSW